MARDVGFAFDRPWRFVLALGACLVLGWFGFVAEQRVPLLGYADLGFHELGHLVFAPFPGLPAALAGNGPQFAVPLGLAVYFLAWRRDVPAGAVCLAWAGTTAQDASVYIADAPYEELQLIGGEHDWAFILGPDGFNAMDRVVGITRVVHDLGAMLVVASLALGLAGLLLAVWGRGRGRTHEVSPTAMPVGRPVISWDSRMPAPSEQRRSRGGERATRPDASSDAGSERY